MKEANPNVWEFRHHFQCQEGSIPEFASDEFEIHVGYND